MTTRLSSAQVDRAAGVLLGMACGDALGAPYEFGLPLGPDVPVAMKGGGSMGWRPGEWTDDTSMAIAIAEVTATGADVTTVAARDQIAARWAEWATNAKDVGVQTRTVLSAATRAARSRGETAPTGDDLTSAAAEHDAFTGRSGGNGSLMRTAPVALAHLHDADALVLAAQETSAMTHHDSEAGEACALWCLAIRHAVLHGTLDIRSGLAHLSEDRARIWTARLDKAEAGQPSDFENNGWVVEALQGAWSAITITAEATGPAHLRLALEAAVRGGRDTDTVAAIAGSLIGGLYGASAVPAQWRRELRGWPGQRARHLIRLGVLTARGGESDSAGWPAVATMDYSKFLGSNALAPHPHDDHVWIGGVDALDNLPDGADAVVSLCRLGSTQVPAPVVDPRDHVEVWLLDESEPDKNPNLDFVLTDAVAAVEALRAEGRTVLLHCVQAQSRTPAVAALYGARLTGRTPTDALDDIAGVLPKASLNSGFRAALMRLA
ncbi:MAG TPA: ADP-ribosylglycohydrolase family protein [Dermatophilaceae bacterium]|nr:ADP-ribosylglycohydrolase family protein [Dermatophilaceae bacterium]